MARLFPLFRNTGAPLQQGGEQMGTPRGAALVATAEGPLGAHDKSTNLTAVQPFTVPDGATSVLVQAIEQNVRVTLDGSDPGGSGTPHGFQVAAGVLVQLPCAGAAQVRVIQEAAGARVQIQFLG